MGRVAAQAALVRAARSLQSQAAQLLDDVDATAPWSPQVAGTSGVLYATIDEVATTVRREIVIALAGVYTHEELGEMVNMSSWWVGKVLREAGRP
ncbi:hypothetical protein [Rhodococcus sp. W8901]|uniref:hypothetical protein n=1 Tax=Rhodococcus sp. W8901 TaxID=2742603 RepID=UPI001581A2A4|nr:hypothetical protein [Rhodococcus sp. W8901]QKT12157.1 hypothetical protein HUN07_16875 [Rhodococcus sp. W8901]